MTEEQKKQIYSIKENITPYQLMALIVSLETNGKMQIKEVLE